MGGRRDKGSMTLCHEMSEDYPNLVQNRLGTRFCHVFDFICLISRCSSLDASFCLQL